MLFFDTFFTYTVIISVFLMLYLPIYTGQIVWALPWSKSLFLVFNLPFRNYFGKFYKSVTNHDSSSTLTIYNFSSISLNENMNERVSVYVDTLWFPTWEHLCFSVIEVTLFWFPKDLSKTQIFSKILLNIDPYYPMTSLWKLNCRSNFQQCLLKIITLIFNKVYVLIFHSQVILSLWTF